jgi:hypothetical protein
MQTIIYLVNAFYTKLKPVSVLEVITNFNGLTLINIAAATIRYTYICWVSPISVVMTSINNTVAVLYSFIQSCSAEIFTANYSYYIACLI